MSRCILMGRKFHQKWISKTGTFTSENSIFTATGFQKSHDTSDATIEPPNAQHAFDNNTTSYIYTNNPNESGHPVLTWEFGRKLKISQVYVACGYGAAAIDSGNRWWNLYGIKKDNSQVLLSSGLCANQGWADKTRKYIDITGENADTEFIGLTIHRGNASGSGWYYFYDLSITSWQQKGND